MASNVTTIPSNMVITSSISTIMLNNVSKLSNPNLVCYRLELLSFQPTPQGRIAVITTSILGAIVSVVATAMNFLTLYVLYQFPNLRSATNSLLVLLAMIDLLVGGAAIPLSIAARVTESMKIHVCWLQILYSFSAFLLTPLFAFAICFISIDRYIAVFYPIAYRHPRLRRKYVIAMPIVALAWLIFISLLTSFVGPMNVKVFRACIGGLLICFIFFVSCCYLKTARGLKVQCRAITDQSNAAVAARRNQTLKLQFKLMTTLVSVFLACYFPKLISVTASMMGISFENFYITTQWSDLSVFLNSAINPSLYMWRIKDLRRAILTVVRR